MKEKFPSGVSMLAFSDDGLFEYLTNNAPVVVLLCDMRTGDETRRDKAEILCIIMPTYARVYMSNKSTAVTSIFERRKCTKVRTKVHTKLPRCDATLTSVCDAICYSNCEVRYVDGLEKFPNREMNKKHTSDTSATTVNQIPPPTNFARVSRADAGRRPSDQSSQFKHAATASRPNSAIEPRARCHPDAPPPDGKHACMHAAAFNGHISPLTRTGPLTGGHPSGRREPVNCCDPNGMRRNCIALLQMAGGVRRLRVCVCV